MDLKNALQNGTPTAIDLLQLSQTIDDAQFYFMSVAKNHGGEITVTFKTETPYVTVFVGAGPESLIGMGSSVPAALLAAINDRNK